MQGTTTERARRTLCTSQRCKGGRNDADDTFKASRVRVCQTWTEKAQAEHQSSSQAHNKN